MEAQIAKHGPHGGPRQGAGRKPLGGRVTRSFTLTKRHLNLLAHYQQRQGLRNASEAIRHLLEDEAYRHLEQL